MTTHMCAEEQKGCTGGCGCTLGAKQRWATQIDGETTVQNASGQESATMPREWRESGRLCAPQPRCLSLVDAIG
jgi:hypothetical protein